MRWINAALFAVSVSALAQVAQVTHGQVSYPPPDVSQVASLAQVTAAANKADQAFDVASAATAKANAAAQPADITAALAAATPSDCPAPLPDALIATAGNLPRCMPRQDAVRATQVQRAMVTTAADGTFSGTWSVPFPSAPGWYQADIDIANATAAPYKCSFVASTVTATGFSGRCVQLIATTLPATLAAVLGLTVSPIANAAGGLTVRVAGRQ
jgi:hypothetical protein